MPGRSVEFETESAEQTERLGAALATALQPGDVVTIEGELGAGKTTLVRGACRALGVREPVTSPTFVLGKTYEGTGVKRVSHIDLYRLGEQAEDEEGYLLDEYLGPDVITFVEWPEHGAKRLGIGDGRVHLVIEHRGRDRRLVRAAGDAEVAAVLERTL